MLGLVQYVLGGKYLGDGRALSAPIRRSRNVRAEARRADSGAASRRPCSSLFGVGSLHRHASDHADAGRRRRRLHAARPDRRLLRLAVLRRRLDAGERKHLYVIGVFFLAAALFWSVFEQAGSTLNLFADRNTQHVDLRLELSEQLVPVAELRCSSSSSRRCSRGCGCGLATGNEPSTHRQVRARPDSRRRRLRRV